MSTWTHIAATIRYDALRIPGMPSMKPDLGKTCSFDSTESEWDACNVPCGSEGSLQHSLWVNPNVTHMAAYVVTIWGDLRDYQDVEEVIDYLKRITGKKMLVRGGVAQIEVSYAGTVVLHYEDEKGWIIDFDSRQAEDAQESGSVMGQ